VTCHRAILVRVRERGRPVELGKRRISDLLVGQEGVTKMAGEHVCKRQMLPTVGAEDAYFRTSRPRPEEDIKPVDKIVELTNEVGGLCPSKREKEVFFSGANSQDIVSAGLLTPSQELVSSQHLCKDFTDEKYLNLQGINMNALGFMNSHRFSGRAFLLGILC